MWRKDQGKLKALLLKKHTFHHRFRTVDLHLLATSSGTDCSAPCFAQKRETFLIAVQQRYMQISHHILVVESHNPRYNSVLLVSNSSAHQHTLRSPPRGSVLTLSGKGEKLGKVDLFLT